MLQAEKLLHHGVVVIPRGESPRATLESGASRVADLLKAFGPNVVALEKTFVGRNRNAALLNVLADEIEVLGKRAGLKVISIAASAVKKVVCGNGWATKSDVAKAVVDRFSELNAYRFADHKGKERFHVNMFDAVAVAMTASGLVQGE